MSSELEEDEGSSATGGAIEPTNVQSGAEVAAASEPDLPAPGGTENSADSDGLPVLRSGRIVDVIADAMTFTIVIARLAIAAVAMRMLSQAVQGAYVYVEDSAEAVDRLADIAASMDVDPSVTSSHHDAAAVTRESLALAEALANEAAEMSSEFDNAAAGHEGDYGDVNEAMQTGDADVAQRMWYSNR